VLSPFQVMDLDVSPPPYERGICISAIFTVTDWQCQINVRICIYPKSELIPRLFGPSNDIVLPREDGLWRFGKEIGCLIVASGAYIPDENKL
jgi:hypothetical protein